MLRRLTDFLRSLLHRGPVRLAIVRRYADANGSYVGELYMEQEHRGVSSYCMIGASLDTLPFDYPLPCNVGISLDTDNDFLAPMPRDTFRVGALDPAENDKVRCMVAGLPRRNMTLVVQNRFIEHVLEPKPAVRDNDYE
jgi:hypothetical protein